MSSISRANGCLSTQDGPVLSPAPVVTHPDVFTHVPAALRSPQQPLLPLLMLPHSNGTPHLSEAISKNVFKMLSEKRGLELTTFESWYHVFDAIIPILNQYLFSYSLYLHRIELVGSGALQCAGFCDRPIEDYDFRFCFEPLIFPNAPSWYITASDMSRMYRGLRYVLQHMFGANPITPRGIFNIQDNLTSPDKLVAPWSMIELKSSLDFHADFTFLMPVMDLQQSEECGDFFVLNKNQQAARVLKPLARHVGDSLVIACYSTLQGYACSMYSSLPNVQYSDIERCVRDNCLQFLHVVPPSDVLFDLLLKQFKFDVFPMNAEHFKVLAQSFSEFVSMKQALNPLFLSLFVDKFFRQAHGYCRKIIHKLEKLNVEMQNKTIQDVIDLLKRKLSNVQKVKDKNKVLDLYHTEQWGISDWVKFFEEKISHEEKQKVLTYFYQNNREWLSCVIICIAQMYAQEHPLIGVVAEFLCKNKGIEGVFFDGASLCVIEKAFGVEVALSLAENQDEHDIMQYLREVLQNKPEMSDIVLKSLSKLLCRFLGSEHDLKFENYVWLCSLSFSSVKENILNFVLRQISFEKKLKILKSISNDIAESSMDVENVHLCVQCFMENITSHSLGDEKKKEAFNWIYDCILISMQVRDISEVNMHLDVSKKVEMLVRYAYRIVDLKVFHPILLLYARIENSHDARCALFDTLVKNQDSVCSLNHSWHLWLLDTLNQHKDKSKNKSEFYQKYMSIYFKIHVSLMNYDFLKHVEEFCLLLNHVIMCAHSDDYVHELSGNLVEFSLLSLFEDRENKLFKMWEGLVLESVKRYSKKTQSSFLREIAFLCSRYLRDPQFFIAKMRAYTTKENYINMVGVCSEYFCQLDSVQKMQFFEISLYGFLNYVYDDCYENDDLFLEHWRNVLQNMAFLVSVAPLSENSERCLMMLTKVSGQMHDLQLHESVVNAVNAFVTRDRNYSLKNLDSTFLWHYLKSLELKAVNERLIVSVMYSLSVARERENGTSDLLLIVENARYLNHEQKFEMMVSFLSLFQKIKLEREDECIQKMYWAILFQCVKYLNKSKVPLEKNKTIFMLMDSVLWKVVSQKDALIGIEFFLIFRFCHHMVTILLSTNSVADCSLSVPLFEALRALNALFNKYQPSHKKLFTDLIRGLFFSGFLIRFEQSREIVLQDAQECVQEEYIRQSLISDHLTEAIADIDRDLFELFLNAVACLNERPFQLEKAKKIIDKFFRIVILANISFPENIIKRMSFEHIFVFFPYIFSRMVSLNPELMSILQREMYGKRVRILENFPFLVKACHLYLPNQAIVEQQVERASPEKLVEKMIRMLDFPQGSRFHNEASCIEFIQNIPKNDLNSFTQGYKERLDEIEKFKLDQRAENQALCRKMIVCMQEHCIPKEFLQKHCTSDDEKLTQNILRALYQKFLTDFLSWARVSF